MRVLHDTLQGYRFVWFLGQATRRRIILLCLAAPRRPAVLRADANRPWYVRVLDSKGCVYMCMGNRCRLSYVTFCANKGGLYRMLR